MMHGKPGLRTSNMHLLTVLQALKCRHGLIFPLNMQCSWHITVIAFLRYIPTTVAGKHNFIDQ